ncbi:hydrolethalus syndrome protein 1 homolog isoform X2 [Oryzias melastigma]|uniref:hydrolethalus syndrome protein 1 homolog isoform X2 n=1 Tax=Oryzias melastigma TaxID=30732 RepID=UPI000CF7B586|nr:hydrolethalus syndrome protein 1 homolog isoform X2 [Oryzias melastigma]
MDHLDFSEKEIRQQLAVLGYRNIPKHKLLEFKKGLEEVIHGGSWKSPTSTAQMNHSEKTQSSPPAFTKEKVSKEFFRSSEGFFLHEGRAEHNKQLLSTHTIGGSGSQQDSYAQNSVAPKLHFPTGGPTRLQVEPDEDVKDSSDSDSWCSDSRQRRFLKRKVLRKHGGQSLVCDESIYSEDSASCLEERLADLHFPAAADGRDLEVESDDWSPSPRSEETDSVSTSAFESYMRTLTRTHSEGDLRPKPKSFIRPVRNQQTVKKCDPVAKYFEYKQIWEMFKLPGEKDRKALRWEIRERLAYQPPPPKPRRVFEPNSYVVPTEKKRSALRWEVRNRLANSLQPHKFSSQP